MFSLKDMSHFSNILSSDFFKIVSQRLLICELADYIGFLAQLSRNGSLTELSESIEIHTLAWE